MSAGAVLLICMCLMFRHGPCIPDGVKIKATYSALQTWIELFSVTSGKQTESHVPYYTVAWCILCFYPRFCFGNSRLTEAGALNSLPPYLTDVVFHCMISLLMVANVWLKSGKQREALDASCAILAQPQSQSKCKWLQVMRKDWMSILHRYPPSLLLHPPISASSLPSLVSLWQPLGILGNRLVYSTFHHIGYWIIHLTISRGQKGGEDELEREWETESERGGGKGRMSEWTGFIPPALVNWL